MEDDIPRYAVVNFWFGVDSEAELTIICRTKRFCITLSAQNLRDPKCTEASKYEREYIQLLSALQSQDSHTEFNPEELDPLDAMVHWVLDPFFPIFRALAPGLSSTPQLQTLHEYFHPPTFFFTLKVDDGTLVPVSTQEDSHSLEYLTPNMEPPQVLLDANVPIFHPLSLLVDWDPEFDGGQSPTKVYGDNQKPYFFKSTHHGKDEAVEREVEILLRLEAAGLTTKICVPRLCGFVQADGQRKLWGCC